MVEIDLEKCNFRNFRSPMTLDQVIRHTVVHQSSTSIYIPNSTEIGTSFCGRTDVRTDVPSDGWTFPPLMLLGRPSNYSCTVTYVKMVWACFTKGQERLDDKCIDYEVEGIIPKGRPKKTWSEVKEKDCQTWQLCKECAMDCRKLWKLIKDAI